MLDEYRGGSRGRVQGVRPRGAAPPPPPPPPRDDLWFSNTTGIMQKEKKPSPKKNPGSTPGIGSSGNRILYSHYVR